MNIEKYIGWIKDKDQSWKNFFIEMIFLVGIVFFIRLYVFQFFRVSGPSMCPTLNQIDGSCVYGKGEFIFVNEFTYSFIRGPKEGEIVVFDPPGEVDKKYIKRVIGVPGETVIIEKGAVFKINEEGLKIKIPEVYLSQKNVGRTYADKTRFVVPEHHYLLFGDNRNQSLDSRKCFSNRGCNNRNTPFVHKKEIIGKAEFSVFPFDLIRSFKNPLKKH